MTELKVCPFCGDDDVRIVKDMKDTTTPVYAVVCDECGGIFYTGDMLDMQSVIEAWNTRPNPWHTGTPTEEGWYLIAYKPIEQDSPLVYYTWHQWRDAEGYWQSDGIRPNDFWKPIAWQKIEEKEDGRTD